MQGMQGTSVYQIAREAFSLGLKHPHMHRNGSMFSLSLSLSVLRINYLDSMLELKIIYLQCRASTELAHGLCCFCAAMDMFHRGDWFIDNVHHLYVELDDPYKCPGQVHTHTSFSSSGAMLEALLPYLEQQAVADNSWSKLSQSLISQIPSPSLEPVLETIISHTSPYVLAAWLTYYHNGPIVRVGDVGEEYLDMRVAGSVREEIRCEG